MHQSQTIDWINHMNTPTSRFTLINIFEDDHEPCINFTYRDKNFGLWWTNALAIGAFEYSDSSKAVAVLEALAEVLDVMIDAPHLIEMHKESDDDSDIRFTPYGFLDYEF